MLFQRMPASVRAVFDAEMDVAQTTDDIELAWRKAIEDGTPTDQPA